MHTYSKINNTYKDENLFPMPENDQSNIDILLKRESQENKLHDQKEYASQFPLTNVLTPINIRFYSSLSIGSFSRNWNQVQTQYQLSLDF